MLRIFIIMLLPFFGSGVAAASAERPAEEQLSRKEIVLGPDFIGLENVPEELRHYPHLSIDDEGIARYQRGWGGRPSSAVPTNHFLVTVDSLCYFIFLFQQQNAIRAGIVIIQKWKIHDPGSFDAYFVTGESAQLNGSREDIQNLVTACLNKIASLAVGAERIEDNLIRAQAGLLQIIRTLQPQEKISNLKYGALTITNEARTNIKRKTADVISQSPILEPILTDLNRILENRIHSVEQSLTKVRMDIEHEIRNAQNAH